MKAPRCLTCHHVLCVCTGAALAAELVAASLPARRDAFAIRESVTAVTKEVPHAIHIHSDEIGDSYLYMQTIGSNGSSVSRSGWQPNNRLRTTIEQSIIAGWYPEELPQQRRTQIAPIASSNS